MNQVDFINLENMATSMNTGLMAHGVIAINIVISKCSDKKR
ncbi:hypothetical protein PFLA_b1136 [Pseudoalteromonas flavipulchra NCIMB 2033 = ATCC BAA-314]|nr:hypothetical protein [Pseudoalteromonas flavipulchra NCIMB 2033 = ATCC BAA-314]